MITKLLKEFNFKMDELNNIIQDENYFKKLDDRIEKTNNHCIDLEKRLNKAIEYLDMVKELAIDNKKHIKYIYIRKYIKR